MVAVVGIVKVIVVMAMVMSTCIFSLVFATFVNDLVVLVTWWNHSVCFHHWNNHIHCLT